MLVENHLGHAGGRRARISAADAGGDLPRLGLAVEVQEIEVSIARFAVVGTPTMLKHLFRLATVAVVASNLRRHP